MRDEPFGVADAFGGDQDALGIHAGEDVAKALALLADEIVRRHPHVLEKHLGGGVIHHGADRPNGQALALDLAHVDEEHRKAGGARSLACSRGVVRASSSIEIGMFGARGPDLLAVDDVVFAVADRRGAQS